MLLLDEPRRFSIDVDIILLGNLKDLEDKLKLILEDSPFNEMEHVLRKKVSGIEKEHYKLYFKPVGKTKYGKENILLDVLIEENPYQETTEKPITSPFLKTIGPLTNVSVPSVKSILADKLTAYPPNTTGIPYSKNAKGMGLQTMKQLFDIARLMESVDNLTDMRADFDHIAKIELEYRKLKMTEEEVLDDIISTSLCLSSKGTEGEGDYQELLTGTRRLVPFIFSEKYNFDKAITNSAKAAYLAHCLKIGEVNLDKYEGSDQVLALDLANITSKGILKLRKGNPEAFYYWHKVLG